MCILFFAINQHKDYPVIICANRDEFHQRPTQHMHWWSKPEILAGKDLQAAGTWMALNKSGGFSALTNFRQPLANSENKRSRGELVVNAISTTNTDNISWSEKLKQETHLYQGYNLVYGEFPKLFCFNSVNQELTEISDGFHSVSNGALDDIWPKMALGIAKLEDEIESSNKSSGNLNIDRLFEIMTNQQKADASQLPQTGIPHDWEQLLSSIFIVSPEYGTRSTTIVTLNNANQLEVYEKNYNSLGQTTDYQHFSLQLA